jgi:hypothetical protein
VCVLGIIYVLHSIELIHELYHHPDKRGACTHNFSSEDLSDLINTKIKKPNSNE